MKRIFVFLIVFAGSLAAYSQCFDENFTFRTGEKIRYHAYYNWGVIWLDAGWVEFEVKDKMFQGREVWHLDAVGKSHKDYDWLFKVRDRFQAYLDKETLRPLWFERKTNEGGYRVHNIYNYKPGDASQVYTQSVNSKKDLEQDTFQLDGCTYDVMTSVYAARNIRFESTEPGEKIPLNMIVDNEVFNLYIRYLGKETIKLKSSRRRFRCHVFSPLLVEGTIFSGGENMKVYVTDDENRIPVMIEAKILIGSVKAILVDMDGLRHPVRAEVFKE